MTSTVMKSRSDEHRKTPTWFANTKVYSLLHFLLIVVKREQRMKTESTAFTRQKETKCQEEKEGEHRAWIIIQFLL